jgi:hypothetical protein
MSDPSSLFTNGSFYSRSTEGYDDIKDIVGRALDAEDYYNLLFVGPPASAKTLFLLGILDMRKDGVYFDGSNTTSRILDVLEDPSILPSIYDSCSAHYHDMGQNR